MNPLLSLTGNETELEMNCPPWPVFVWGIQALHIMSEPSHPIISQYNIILIPYYRSEIMNPLLSLTGNETEMNCPPGQYLCEEYKLCLSWANRSPYYRPKVMNPPLSLTGNETEMICPPGQYLCEG